MASANSLRGLMKWLRRAEWQDAFDELLHRHLAPACAKVDVAVDELPELIGDQHLTVLWSCVFEDFLARNLDDRRNIIEAYLKRRGWKESALNKAYMVALRSSAMCSTRSAASCGMRPVSPAIWCGAESRLG